MFAWKVDLIEKIKERSFVMKKLIMALYETLNRIKGFETGYTSSIDNKMIIDYGNDRYIIEVKKIDNKSENMLDDIRKYLK